MSKYELSVIIPLHNTDMRLFSSCVSSLKAQEAGFENIELIVVMHNCNQETIRGVRGLLSSSVNVVLAELNNDVRSPSSPRNFGIAHATGDYITFLDADDMFTPECLRLALEYVKKSDADVCHFRKKIQLEKEGAITFNELELWDQTREMIVMEHDSWDEKQLFSGVWGMSTGRLYRRKLLMEADLRFDESIRFAEDYHFVIGVYAHARRICLAPQLIGYIYYVNSQSLVQTTKITEELLLDYVSGYKKVFDRGIEAGFWMNDTMGSLMLIILNWMQACPDLSDEGRKKLKQLMGPYIRSLKPLPPIKLYPSGKNDRINTFLTKYILREEPHVETYIARADEGAGHTLPDRQKDALARILRNGMKSDYSVRYDFGSIATIEEYERRLPLSGYGTYLPMIRLTTEMGERGIFTDLEIISYAICSDAEDGKKRIPITYKAIVPYVNALRRCLGSSKTFLVSEALPFEASRLTMDFKYTNTIFGVMLKEYAAEAESFGGGYATFTTPKEYLFPVRPCDMNLTRLVFALKEKDVKIIFAPDMAALSRQLKELESSFTSVCGEIGKTDAGRAGELRELFKANGTPSLKKLWPELEKVVCWNFTDREIPEDIKPWLEDVSFSRGYYADEYALYGSICEDGSIELDPDHVFFEFLSSPEDDDCSIHTMAGISEGEEYTLVLSNLCGLYRYDTGYCVKCVKIEKNRLLASIVN